MSTGRMPEPVPAHGADNGEEIKEVEKIDE